MWVILSGKCISGEDDVTLYVILLGRCISTNLVQRESSVQIENCCAEDTDDHQQCTMCILGTMFTLQPNKLRHILKVAS